MRALRLEGDQEPHRLLRERIGSNVGVLLPVEICVYFSGNEQHDASR